MYKSISYPSMFYSCYVYVHTHYLLWQMEYHIKRSEQKSKSIREYEENEEEQNEKKNV